MVATLKLLSPFKNAGSETWTAAAGQMRQNESHVCSPQRKGKITTEKTRTGYLIQAVQSGKVILFPRMRCSQSCSSPNGQTQPQNKRPTVTPTKSTVPRATQGNRW